MSWDNFTYKKQEPVERKPGKYRCVILKAEVGTSKKSGNRMIVITLRPSGTASSVLAYIVDNEYFDSNYSSFLDAFPILKSNSDPGNCFSWRGAMGAVKLKVNENGYFEPERYPWIPAEQADNMPEFVWKNRDDEPAEMPAYNGITDLDEVDDPEDECPF